MQLRGQAQQVSPVHGGKLCVCGRGGGGDYLHSLISSLSLQLHNTSPWKKADYGLCGEVQLNQRFLKSMKTLLQILVRQMDHSQLQWWDRVAIHTLVVVRTSVRMAIQYLRKQFYVLLNKETWSLKSFRLSSLANTEPCELVKKKELCQASAASPSPFPIFFLFAFVVPDRATIPHSALLSFFTPPH